MTESQRAAIRSYRARTRGRGLQRVEVLVPAEDAVLLRLVARALSEPGTAASAREDLRRRFQPRPARNFKEMLASAPLEGIDLERSPDTGRDIEF